MNQSTLPFFTKFVRMHKRLIKSFYIMDTLFIICTAWYIFTPITIGIYPFRTIVLLFLFLLCFIGLHMRIMASQIGSISFYRLLPVHRFPVYIKSHFVILFPFSVALFSIALFPISIVTISEKILKSSQIVAIFCTIKFLTLPALLLLRRSLFLLPGLFLMIIPIALAISAGNECIWKSLPLPEAWDMGFFSILLFGLETIIIKTVKVS